MYLKQLELLGFKSFPNKTLVRFSEGVTAIVGPNGCGKTNILDALRWVLGEQRPTMLRGGKMEEVIFNGTRDLKPLGMSEVTLTVVNDRGVLPTEYHEVQITRRLFRNDESEYLLNKIPCRLKDITDLFVDTGMGAHSYSVIQQDMIEAVISDKAEERRFLFEEAAGITKYKQRKRAALRKLEATENDFLRLNDIYAEVKSRVTSLQRQQKKAERYVQVRDEIRDWELFLGGTRLGQLEQERRQLRSTYEQLNDKRLAAITSMDKLAAETESERQRLAEIESRLSEIALQTYQASEQAHEHEKELSVLQNSVSHSESLIERNTIDLQSIEERLRHLATQISESEKELESHRKSLADTVQLLSDAQKSQAERDRDLLGARSAREQEQVLLLELEGRLSSGRTEETGLKEQMQELQSQTDSFASQQSELEQKKQQLAATIAEKESHHADLKKEREQIIEKQQAFGKEMESLVAKTEELASQMSTVAASIEACEARRNLLEEMMIHYEGYESGTVAAMAQRGRWPGIVGTVAEKFVPTEGMETALESALGEIAGFIICQDKQTAEGVIGFLRSESKGKVGILVPSTGGLNTAVKRPILELPGVVGWLDSFVTTDDFLRPLKEAVLSRTVVFDQSADPTTIMQHLPYGFTAVSTDGVVYGSYFLTGGSDDHFPLFRRREKVDEQQRMIADLGAQLETARSDRGKATARLAAIRAESGVLAGKDDVIREELESLQRAIDDVQYQKRTVAQEMERIAREKSTVQEKLTRIQQRQYVLGLDSTQLASRKEILIAALQSAGTRLDEVERAAGVALDAVAKLQVKQIEIQSRVQGMESNILHTNEIADELRRTKTTKLSENSTAAEQIASAANRREQLSDLLKTTYARREELNAQQETVRAEQAVVLEQVQAVEKKEKQLRDERDTLGEQLHAIDLKLNTLASEATSLSEQIRREYDIDLSQIEPRRPNADITDDQAQRHLSELKDRLKGFGAVNLIALEEYKEFSEREKFLSEQIKDLNTAKNDLAATITKINQTAKELFEETLGKVRVNFQNLFTELFNGGEADVRLENPDDPLESNIEIIARPRGKRLLSITMMSGGERALTAISLLFSLYLVKPSPFCILDEIDAPLDDANCRRFLTLIRKFAKETQFITITHNKITMEAADNLYGITMEQPGVSKLVAVKFSGGLTDSGEELPVSVITEREEDPELPRSIASRLGSNVSLSTDEQS